MTDKIKLKADKFINDKKLKLNYIKPKDLKILLAEFCEEQIAELKAECDLAIEGKDVEIKELETQIEKVKCTLKKIIETVHNDRIDEYGTRLVLINDSAYECLEEIEKMRFIDI